MRVRLSEGAGREAHGDRGGTVVVVLGVVEHGAAAVGGEDRGEGVGRFGDVRAGVMEVGPVRVLASRSLKR
jgi:hypothetical protein